MAGAQAPAAAPAAQPAPSTPAFKQENSTRPARPDRALPGRAAVADPDGVDLPAGDRRGGALAEGERVAEGTALEDAARQRRGTRASSRCSCFPTSLSRMNQDLTWTQKLGDASPSRRRFWPRCSRCVSGRSRPATSSPTSSRRSRPRPGRRRVIVIEPANPQVVYVPTYQPTLCLWCLALPCLPALLPAVLGAGRCGLRRRLLLGVGIAAGAASGAATAGAAAT